MCFVNLLGRISSDHASQTASMSAYVIVAGNEKGGSGKSTIAVHIAVALLKAGQRVATIDIDSRQKSFTHYIQNRVAWCKRNRLDLEIPTHCLVEQSLGIRADDNEIAEANDFLGKVARLEHKYDFIVIDTPGSDTYLTRLAHTIADTLITPLNDSFLDFDVLATLDPTSFTVTGKSQYAEMVHKARHHRRLVDGQPPDWVVVRNRLSSTDSYNKRNLAKCLKELRLQLECRCVEGFSERVIYREFFPRGLTALDINKSTLGKRPSRSHVAARQEVESLLDALKLPINDKGRRRVAARLEWFANRDKPLEVHDILK
jgi:chromosome partitioning protein